VKTSFMAHIKQNYSYKTIQWLCYKRCDVTRFWEGIDDDFNCSSIYWVYHTDVGLPL